MILFHGSNVPITGMKANNSVISTIMNITEAEFRYLKESLAKDLIAMLMEKHGLNMEQAFQTYYASNIYQKILNPETGLYFQSPGYVYSYLEEEIIHSQQLNKNNKI